MGHAADPKIRLALGATVLTRAGNEVDGIGVMVRQLQRHLPAQGVSVEPWAFPEVSTRQHRAGDGHEYAYFPYSFNASLLRTCLSNRAAPGAAMLNSRVDLFHAADYRIPRLHPLPVVATLHDAIPVMAPHWVNPRLRRLKNLLLRRTAAWADHVTALSVAMMPDLVRYLRVREKTITVVPPGVDQRFFDPIDPERMEQVLDRYGLRPGYVLTVGTLQPRKNFSRLIRAHRALPPALRREHPLVIVGKAGWRVEDALREIAHMEAADEGRWLRFVPQQDLYCLYHGARVFAFPSLYEGFGLPVLEAFASDLPVVTSNTSALPEAAGDAALLVNPESEPDIATALHELLVNTALADQLRQRGLKRAQHFSWERCAEGMVAVYRQVLAGT